MVVGASFGQIPAIKAAKSLGLRVVVVDGNPKAAGMPLADVALPIDLRDIDGVVAAAKEHGISGVMTMQSDVGIPAVGAVVDALGLPSNGTDVAMRCSNKIDMRSHLEKLGVPQPRYRIVRDEKQANDAARDLGLPCIVKAPDSSGSRGVVKVSNLEEMASAVSEARKHTLSEFILVEEFVDGLEVGAQAFSLNAKCVMVLIHDDYLSSPPFMIPVGHAFPATLSFELQKKIENAVSGAVEALGIESGPSNIDIIMDRDGEPKIIEVGARIGATCLPELVQYHTGIDWVEASVLAALGRPVSLVRQKSMPVVAMVLQSPKDGVLRECRINDSKVTDSILEYEISIASGQPVSKMRKGTDRIGKVIASGKSTETALKTVIEFIDSIEFVID